MSRFASFLRSIQLPFMGVVLIASAGITCLLHTACPWSQRRPVEVALKLVAPPLLTLGAWAPLVFEPRVLSTDPFGAALVACLLLRIIMFTNKAHSMQTGGTDLWRSWCWLLLAAC